MLIHQSHIRRRMCYPGPSARADKKSSRSKGLWFHQGDDVHNSSSQVRCQKEIPAAGATKHPWGKLADSGEGCLALLQKQVLSPWTAGGWSLGQQIRSELVCGGESRLGEQLSTGTNCLHSLPLEEGSCKADTENLIGREEARFQRGLNPTQRSLGFIQ